MNRITFTSAVVACVLGWTPLAAQESRPAAKTAPDASALIDRLEDESYATRKSAMDELKALGEAARPALEQHRDDRRLETRTRVRELLAELDAKGPGKDGLRRLAPTEPGAGEDERQGALRGRLDRAPFDLPQLEKQLEEMRRWQAEVDKLMRGMTPPLGQDPFFGPGQGFSFDFSPGGFTSSRSFTRDGETVTLKESDQGAKLVVRTKDGAETTYEGSSAEDLRAKHPDLAEKYGDTGLFDGSVRVFRGAPTPRASEEPEDDGAATRSDGMRRLSPADPEPRPRDARGNRAPKVRGGGAPPAAEPLRPTPSDPEKGRPAARLGVFAGPVPALLDKHLKLRGVGVLIDAVEPGGAAEAAGLQVDDVVTHVAGEAVTTVEDLRRLVQGRTEPYVVRAIREGSPVESTVDPNRRR